MGRLAGKTAVITGAAQGIGALMAKAMADAGAQVLVTDVQDTAKAVAAITDVGGTAQGMTVDVTNNDDLGAMVDTAKSMGGLDIMVNNASIFATLKPKPFFEVSDEEFDLIMKVNARGVHQVMRAIVPTMIQAGGGKVINIASGTFYYGPPGLSHYTASKGAVIALTRCHGRELGDKNIQVNAIAPGLTESEGLAANAGFDMARGPTVASRSIKREMLPEDLLGTLLYLASSDSNFVTGQTLNVDGGKVNV
ncbi:MAG: SDR family oxidoreductase [Pseudomonadota bacterium]